MTTTEQLLREARYMMEKNFPDAESNALMARIDAHLAQPAASEPQPVAWQYRNAGGTQWTLTDKSPAGEWWEVVPLFAAPPAARVALSEWIACSDRLPDEGTHCFVVGPRYNDYRRGQYTAEALFIDGKFLSHDEGDDLYEPSHWFPIPILPAAPDGIGALEKA